MRHFSRYSPRMDLSRSRYDILTQNLFPLPSHQAGAAHSPSDSAPELTFAAEQEAAPLLPGHVTFVTLLT